MKIVVAGAGAGKTTSMAQVVLDRLKEVVDGRIIYVITYTNAARDRIREKIIELNGKIPKQLFIETSHAFLLREFIFPFHHLLYEQQFIRVSQIKLSDNARYKGVKIKELSGNKIIHVEKVTETAKWIVHKKSKDKKETKEKRKKILKIISRYLDSVFIDESQDMDQHLAEIVEVLDNIGINMYLVGDPKQDLRGRNAFKQLISQYEQNVEYISKNHRCPISHVHLANTYISKEEQQIPQTDAIGKLDFVFESDVEINNFFNDESWDYAFIYKKNERFRTHANDKNIAEKNLTYELNSLLKKSLIDEREVDKYVYYLKKSILKNLVKINIFELFSRLENLLSIKLTSQDKGKLADVLKMNHETPATEGILVHSIDSIKGLEGNKCLFILTTDLAPYFFDEKQNQNKMLNYLYVALTRAKEELFFLITNEVENRYSKEAINKYFEEIISMKVTQSNVAKSYIAATLNDLEE